MATVLATGLVAWVLAGLLVLLVLRVVAGLKDHAVLKDQVAQAVQAVRQVHREVQALQVVVAALEGEVAGRPATKTTVTATTPGTTTQTTPAKGTGLGGKAGKAKDTTSD